MTNEEVAKVLQSARDLIAKPENWIQRYDAVDAKGNYAYADSPSACKWCALGAILKVSPNSGTGFTIAEMHVVPALPKAYRIATPGYYNLTEYNDTHTHRSVIKMFDKVISQLLT